MGKHAKNKLSHPNSGGSFCFILGLIVFFALILRLWLCRDLALANGGINSAVTPGAASDLHTYMQLGRDIAHGRVPSEFYYQPFYYAVFLPVIYLCSGFSVSGVMVVQALLGAATCGLVGLIARQLAGKTAAYVAAGLTALSIPLLLYTPFHQNETLQAFNLTLLLFLLWRVLRHPANWRWAGVGLISGVAILTRGNILLFLPLMIGGALWNRAPWKNRLKNVALLLGCCIVVQLPFIVYNTHARGKLTGPSTARDAVLALGNTKEAPPGGRNPGWFAGPMEYPESYHRAMKRSSHGESLPQQMGQWLCEEPGAFLELQLRKLWLFWDGREIPNNVSWEGERRYTKILQPFTPGNSYILLTLGLAGALWYCFRRQSWHSPRIVMLIGFIVIYWGTIALFYNLSRFRAPIIPLVAVLAGAMVAQLLHLRRKKGETRRVKLLLSLACLGAGAYMTTNYDNYASCEPGIMRIVRPQGVILRDPGEPTVWFDHGPVTFGGWDLVKLTSGAVLTKINGSGIKGAGEVELTVAGQGEVVLQTEKGTRIRQVIDAKNNRIKFNLPEIDRQIELQVVEIYGEIAALIDRHRDYRRSGFNGEPIAGEWVLRIRFQENKEQK